MMKKSIFAVAVASVLTLGAAQAETVLYGSIRYDYENKKTETLGDAVPYWGTDSAGNLVTKSRYTFNSERVSNLEDAGSRIGVKGSEDLGNGNAVIYQLEWGFNGMDSDASGFSNRLAILGLTGNWGTFTAGRQDNPFKVTIVDDSVVDDFNGSNVISSASQRAMTSTLNGTGLVGSNTALYSLNGYPIVTEQVYGGFADTAGLTGDAYVSATLANQAKVDSLYAPSQTSFSRVGKVIAYTTPDFAGFQANAALMMDEKNTHEKHVDLWTINARYAHDFGAAGTLLAKAGYIQGKTADDNASKVWGLFLGYSQDAFSITGSYANGNHKPYALGSYTFAGTGLTVPYEVETEKQKTQGWDLGASFSFGPNYFSTVRATYGQSQIKVGGHKDKVKSWAVGFEQKLSTRTRAWVEYGQEETKYAAVDLDKKKDNVVSIGMRHDF